MTATQETAASCSLAPVRTDECNFSFGLPLSMVDLNDPTAGAMPCIRDVANGMVTSFWRPDDGEELIDAVYGDTGIHVTYWGYSPHTRLGLTRDTLAAAALRGEDPAPHKLYPGRSWTAMGYDDEVRKFLADGGYFVLQTHMCPPPAVQVWIA